MNEPVPPPLDDDLREYLDAAREPEPTSPATKERLFARLVPFLPPEGGGGGGAPGDGGAGPAIGGGAATAAGAASGLLQGKLVVAAVSALIGAVGGATMHATFAPPNTVTVVTTVTATGAPPLEVSPAPSIAPVPSVEAPAPSASVAAAPSVSNEPSGPRKSTMRAERILLEAANAAIIRGDYAAAIASLQQHKQSYPRGELAQERDILMAQANKLKAEKGPAPR